MKKIYIILILVVGALVSSCAKEPHGGGGEELTPGTVAVQFVMDNGEKAGALQSFASHTRATTEGTPAENHLSKIQLLFWSDLESKVMRYIAFDHKTQVIDPNIVWNATTSTLTFKNMGANTYTIYAMANGKGDELSENFTSQAEILAKIASQQGAIIDPVTNALPMSGFAPLTVVSGDNSAKVTVPLQRMVAKVNVSVVLGKAFTDAFPSVTFGTDATGWATEMTLINTPQLTYIYPKIPAEMPLDAVSPTDISDMIVAESGAAAGMTWKSTAYTLENLTADAATSMNIGVYLPYKDGSNPVVTSNYYQLEVNHTAMANRVERNKIYNVTITVNGFGKEAVTVTTAVKPWNVENIETDVQGGAIKPNKTTVELLDENLNTELIIAYSGMAPLTITPDDPAKFTSITRDAATGIVTIKAKHDNSTAPNPDFATLTISNGDTRLDRTVEVKYTPITVTGLPTTRQDISDIARTKVLSGITISHTAQVKYLSTDKLNATYIGTEFTVNTTELNKDGSIIKPMAWSVNITANNGRVVGTVNFRYEPLCWAPGDIALSADNKYIIGGVTSDKTLIFQGGSKYGIVGVETTSWVAPATKSYYAPTTVGGAVTSGAAVTFTAFSTISHASGQGLGDPCTYIGGDKWRSPVSSELKLLLPGTNPDPINGKVASKSGIRGWQLAVYDLFFPWDYAIGKSMSQINHDAANVTHLVGYRWSKTSGKTSVGALPAYYAILCDNYNNVANIPRFNWDNERLLIPVRCVRDFTGVEPTE